MDVTDDVTATLRAEAHHPPCVLESAGFCTEHSAKSRSIGYEEETSPTLRAGVVPAAVALENHPTDRRLKIAEDGKVQTLTSRMGTDGNGGNPGCNQDGIAIVCVDQGGGKSSCSVSEGLSPTLACTHGGEPVVCLQGSMIGRDDKNGPQGNGINEEVSFTLNTVDRHAVYAMTSGYTVRRLTPTECARLQGFPDNWCADLGTEKPTDEELYFWHKVFKTYSEITGCKMKSDKQVAKWLKDPHSDSAEYKMWGNGVALPCVYFVLSGIVWADCSAAKSNTQEEAQIIREV